jgi:hypothetical protein
MNMGCPCHKKSHYQLSYEKLHESVCYNKAYQLTVKNMQNKNEYYKKTVECRNLIFEKEVRGGSTVMLQDWSQIKGFQSTRFPC